MSGRRRIALLSVSDKTGLIDLANGLVRAGFEVVSTGGTQRTLAEAGVPVFFVRVGTQAQFGGSVRQAIMDGFAELVERIQPPLLPHVTHPLTLARGYQGKGMPEGQVSLSLRLTFRSADRTLTDAEVQKAMDDVLRALRDKHSGVQR